MYVSLKYTYHYILHIHMHIYNMCISLYITYTYHYILHIHFITQCSAYHYTPHVYFTKNDNVYITICNMDYLSQLHTNQHEGIFPLQAKAMEAGA